MPPAPPAPPSPRCGAAAHRGSACVCVSLIPREDVQNRAVQTPQRCPWSRPPAPPVCPLEGQASDRSMGAKGPCGHLATEDTRLPTQRRSPSEAIREVRVTLHFHQDAQDKNSEAPKHPGGPRNWAPPQSWWNWTRRPPLRTDLSPARASRALVLPCRSLLPVLSKGPRDPTLPKSHSPATSPRGPVPFHACPHRPLGSPEAPNRSWRLWLSRHCPGRCAPWPPGACRPLPHLSPEASGHSAIAHTILSFGCTWKRLSSLLAT